MTRTLLAISLVASLTLGAGCGILDTSILFNTGEQSINLDTSGIGITIPGGKTVIPSIPCTSNATCNAAGLKCGSTTFECTLKCINKSCAFVATVEQSTKVDISGKIKNNSLLAAGISKVSFEWMNYSAPQNSFNFDTPQLGLYIGPEAAKTTKSGAVVHFATLPPIKRKTNPSDARMTVTEAGKLSLQAAILNYKSPFRIFGKASLTFKAGDQLPTGKMLLKVDAFFTVDPF